MSVSERIHASDRRLSLLGDQPGAYAIARHTRISPMKARRVVNLVRGAAVQDALDILQFAPQSAAETVRKVLLSAIANAETTEGLPASGLVISQARVDEGPTMKRWRPRAKGRATRINKRTSHITLVVQPGDVVAAHKSAAQKSAAQKSAAQKSAAQRSVAQKSAARMSVSERGVEPHGQQTAATLSEKGRTA